MDTAHLMDTAAYSSLSPQNAHNIYLPHMIIDKYTRAYTRASALDPPRALPCSAPSPALSNISMYKLIYTNKKKQLYI